MKPSSNTSAIMHSTYKSYDPNMNVTKDDKDGIDYIYGRKISPLLNKTDADKFFFLGIENDAFSNTLINQQVQQRKSRCSSFQSLLTVFINLVNHGPLCLKYYIKSIEFSRSSAGERL